MAGSLDHLAAEVRCCAECCKLCGGLRTVYASCRVAVKEVLEIEQLSGVLCPGGAVMWDEVLASWQCSTHGS